MTATARTRTAQATGLSGQLHVKPFTIVGKKRCFDTIKELEELLELARKGEIVGIAYAVLRPRQRYDIGYTGQFLEYPDPE
jgi:hypothetical protein